jgi:REP element-mobilizing transposase RayT
MPQRKVPLVPGEYFHVFNRGLNSEIVFRSDRNYLFFLRRITELLIPKTASIIAYVLMPTHYHLLIQINNEDFSEVMGRLSLSYTKAVNREWERSGPLFESRFKAKLVDTDKYILGLSRYIHLNPVSAHLVEKPEEWPYSNYRDLISQTDEALPLENLVHSYFDHIDQRTAYQSFVQAGKSEKESFEHLLFD